MKIIISPVSFKGSLSAFEAASAMKEGIFLVDKAIKVEEMPIADGGEGTVDVIAGRQKGNFVRHVVPGPDGQPVDAKYFLSETGTAYIELAQASGLTLLKRKKRIPILASTYGTGVLIKDALDHGAHKICLTLGGSATNDGGAGIAKALGIRIVDNAGEEVVPNCLGLSCACNIDLSHMDKRLSAVDFEIACDVQNPLCGEWGASFVYGPQKGANETLVKQMDSILYRYGRLLADITGKEIVLLPGSGAAGGAALPLLAFANARLSSGIDMVLDAVKIDESLKDASLVLTGEGKIDRQTNFGKAIHGLHKRTAPRGIPLLAFGGHIEEGISMPGLYLYGINPPGEKTEISMEHAHENLRRTVADRLSAFLREKKV